MTSHIFLSYANEDRERARRVADVLELEGYDVFWDREIPVGLSWQEFIGRKLGDAGCVVVLWSDMAVQSDWVLEEAEMAREAGRLVPAMIDATAPPIGFKRMQAADLSNWRGDRDAEGFRRLVEAVARVLKSDDRTPDVDVADVDSGATPRTGPVQEPQDRRPETRSYGPGSPPTRRGHLRPGMALTLIAVPAALYWIWTAILLAAGDSDRLAGFLHLPNALAFGAGLWLVSRERRRPSTVMLSVGLIQLVVCSVMLFLAPSISAWEWEVVVLVNAPIIAVAAVLASLFKRWERQQAGS